MIEKSKELPVLYDSDRRNCVAIYLKNCDYKFQNEKEEEDSGTDVPERNTSPFYAKLRVGTQCDKRA